MSVALPGTQGLLAPFSIRSSPHSHMHIQLSQLMIFWIISIGYHAPSENVLFISSKLYPWALVSLAQLTQVVWEWEASSLFPPTILCPNNQITRHGLGTLPFQWILWTLWFSSENPEGTINNSKLELAATITQHDVIAQLCLARCATIPTLHDNAETIFWQCKGSTSSNKPAAYLLQLQALHAHAYKHRTTHDFILGPSMPWLTRHQEQLTGNHILSPVSLICTFHSCTLGGYASPYLG